MKSFKVGDHVNWNSEAGHVTGKIIKVHHSNFKYKGYTHHANKDDPQYEIRSDKSDHIAAHKGTALTKIRIRKMKLKVIKGDITTIMVDAIVNAANSSLMGGGGVDGAIHRAGGTEILEECKKIVEQHGKCSTGEAVITTAGKLPSKYVIHTVGPVWNGGKNNEENNLANCYKNSLQLAVENNCTTVAFPNISTGVYHFPKDEAAKIAVESVRKFLSEQGEIEEVIFVCFDDDNYNLIKRELEKNE